MEEHHHWTDDWPHERLIRPILMYCWLAALSIIIPGIASGVDDPAVVATAALAGFVTLYVTTTWLAVAHPGRQRDRGLALAGLAAITLAATVAFSEVWLILFLFLAVACAVSVPGRWAILAVIATTVAAGLVARGKPIEGGGVVSWMIGPFFGGMMNIYFLRTQVLISELRETREELAQLAVEEERLRFARDLHDLLGHSLSLIVVKSEAVRRLIERDPIAAARQAADIEEVGRQAIAEVREAVTGYRRRDLAAELDGARSALATAGVGVTVSVTTGSLPSELDALFGRVVREGITNVIRHSHARRCEIDVAQHNGSASLQIRDDGSHHSDEVSESSGSGLRGLAERISAVGGQFNAGPV